MTSKPDAFALFALYYLGVAPDGSYRFSNANNASRILGCTVHELMGMLKAKNIHPDTVLNTDFPLSRHQVAIQFSAQEQTPADLLKSAQAIYESFLQNAHRKRDWLAEIEREKREGTQPKI